MAGNERVDVLIIGSGASGAAAAWSLADTKMRILCLEQGDWVRSTDFPSNGRDWESRRYTDFDISPNRRGRDTEVHSPHLQRSDQGEEPGAAASGHRAFQGSTFKIQSDGRLYELGVARDYRRLALAHPHVVPLLVTRPLATPLGLRPQGTLRPLEDVLALLTRAGFTGPDALHIYRALFGFLHGHVLNELQELVENPDETDDLLRLGLHRLPIGEFPLLRSLASVLASYDGAAELERGLDILLAGLTATLTPRRSSSPAAGEPA